MEISSASNCYCDKFNYDHHAAPLGSDILVLLHYLRVALGNCSLTGGAVLAQIIYQNTKCHHCCTDQAWNVQQKRCNTDIDFFVPRFPSELNKLYGQPINTFYEESSDGPVEFFDSFESNILPWFNRTFKPAVKGLLKVAERKTNSEAEPNYYNIKGIYEIVELKFENSEKKLQIIVLESMPEMQENWCTFVTSSFDIDIVRNRIGNLGIDGKPDIGFIDDTAAKSYENSSFVFTVRPMETFERGFERIHKYMKRGFSLSKIVFDSRLLPFWKQYWLGRFWLLFTKTWTLGLLQNGIERKLLASPREEKAKEVSILNSLFDRVDQNKDVCDLIGQFLWVPPTRALYQDMKREQKYLESIRQKPR